MLATVVVALGSNLGDRRYHILRATHELGTVIRVVRASAIHESIAVDSPPNAPPFLNRVVLGYATLAPLPLLRALLAIEAKMGRARRGIRNEPRLIDLDLILHSAHRLRSPDLTLPHPRAHQRAFVLQPLAECGRSFASMW
jgi:2-amino-4-hydroxy-6-hydroxymethyldihydropteridine diphosphokinase